MFHNRGDKRIISTSASEKSISDEFLISMLKINNNEMSEYTAVGHADSYENRAIIDYDARNHQYQREYDQKMNDTNENVNSEQ